MSKVALRFYDDHSGFLLFTNWHRLISSMHRHDDLEVNLVESGSLTYLVDGKQYDMQRGSCLWLFPEQEHQIVKASRDLSLLVVVSKADALKQQIRSDWASPLLQREPEEVLCRRLSSAGTEQSLRCAHQISNEPGRFELVESGLNWLLFSIWYEFLKASRIIGDDCHPIVERCLSLINEDPLLQTSELSERLHVSRSHLSSLFGKQIGQTIPEYRNAVRVENFLSGYKKNRTLLAGAIDAGFGSYAQFYRIFTDVTGQTPRSYISEHLS